MLKNVLIAAAAFEVAFGVFAFVLPRTALVLLLGSEPVPIAVVITRVAGIAIVCLGVACYPGGPRQGLYGMLAYGVLVMVYLIVVAIGGTKGILLWPAIVVHALLSVSLIVAARAHPPSSGAVTRGKTR